MRFSFFLFVLLLGCEPANWHGNSEDVRSVDGAIVGGQATTIDQTPWQVSIQATLGGHFCGGSIIAPNWIVTATHCLLETPASSLRVVAGFTRRSEASSGQTRNVKTIVNYPGYSEQTNRHDLSLLELEAPLDLSGPNARAISLVTPVEESAGLTNPGVMATVSGWGTLAEGAPSIPDTLQRVEVPIVSNASAQDAYGAGYIFPESLAAGAAGKDSCQGDSGGPLVVPSAQGQFRLAGVVSWGIGCGQAQYPGVYTRIASYASWIMQQAGIPTVGPVNRFETLPADRKVKVAAGSTVVINAQAFDVNNQSVAFDAASWSAQSAIGAATPKPGQLELKAATTMGVFPDSIQLTKDSVTVSFNVTIEPGPLRQLQISPVAKIKTSSAIKLQVTGEDEFKNPRTPQVTWSATAGTITSDGTYTAPSQPGTYTVTASEGDVKTSTPLLVEAAQVLRPGASSLAPETSSTDGTHYDLTVVGGCSQSGAQMPLGLLLFLWLGIRRQRGQPLIGYLGKSKCSLGGESGLL